MRLNSEMRMLLDKLYNLRGEDSVVLVSMDKERDQAIKTKERTSKRTTELTSQIEKLESEGHILAKEGESFKSALEIIRKDDFINVLKELNIAFDPEEIKKELEVKLPKTLEEFSMEKLFGIDISHWQGDMSIEQARNERGVKFAIIKAAGADDGKYKDSKFENYYAQCKAIGLPVGAYYYGNAKSVAEAEQEADHFLSVIAGKQFEYPIYYDVEGKMLNNSRDVLTNIVIAFCDRCEKAGYFVGVYTSDSHFQAHVDDDRLQRFTHWVARYSSNEPVTGHDIWQYGGEYNYIADKTICGRTVDQDFCYRDFETEIKKAGLNGFSASTGDEAKEPEISEPEGSTLDLLYRTMKDEFGGGDARKAALGSRYNEVQDVINHIDKASVQELVDEVWAGKYGDDEVRRTVLGSRWQEVQDVINAGNKKYYTIKSGDTLSGIAAKYETTVNAIAQLNGIENPNLIIAGDTIRVK